MARKKAGRLLRAKEGFQMPDGFVVGVGDLISPDHPVAKTYKDLLEEVSEEDYIKFYTPPKKEERVVEATKRPGKKRGEK